MPMLKFLGEGGLMVASILDPVGDPAESNTLTHNIVTAFLILQRVLDKVRMDFEQNPDESY